MALERNQLLTEVRRRPVTFIPGKKSLSRMPGDWSSPFSGKGYEPVGYRDYALGDDPRRINLVASARRGRPTIVERIALREFNIMIVADDSASMRVRRKWDVQIAAVLLLLYSAWKAETTFGIAVWTGTGVKSFGLGLGSRHFYRLQRMLWAMQAGGGAGLVKGSGRSLSRCLPANSMMLFCSDFLDEHGNAVCVRDFSHPIRRYDFVPIIIQDELEYSFPAIPMRTAVPLRNPETGVERDTWLSPAVAASIRAAHEHRFRQLTDSFIERDARAIHLDTADVSTMSRRIDTYFRRRRGT